MAKRKPGRPRKVAESFEFSEPAKRKPGRPRKNAAPVVESAPEPVQSLYRYTVKTVMHDGYTDGETVEANDFIVTDDGNLLLFVGPETVAAFRQWIGITGEKLPQPVVVPEVTLSAAQPENVPNTTGYQFQATSAELLAGSAFQNAWPPNGDLNQALHQANGVAGLEVPSAVDASAGLAGGINGPSPE
jgi:hypothetical protein